jgi:hypothetical protein
VALRAHCNLLNEARAMLEPQAAFAAFGWLTDIYQNEIHAITRERQVAQGFVRAMWTPGCDCFAAGTSADGMTKNRLLALDATIWHLLALPGAAARYGSALATARSRLREDGGFAYSEAKEGLWTPGNGTSRTAHGADRAAGRS